MPFDCARLLISSTVLRRESWSDRDTKTGRMYLIRAAGGGRAMRHALPPRGRTGQEADPRMPEGRTPGWVGFMADHKGVRRSPKASGDLGDSMKPTATTLSIHRDKPGEGREEAGHPGASGHRDGGGRGLRSGGPPGCGGPVRPELCPSQGQAAVPTPGACHCDLIEKPPVYR